MRRSAGGELRFATPARARGILGDDLRQMSALERSALVLIALAIAVGLGYLAWQLAGG